MENSQKVRHIPIFVEGRDEPIINKDHNASQNNAGTNNNASAQNSSNAFASAESSSGPFQQHQNSYFQPNNHHNFNSHRPQMNFNDMDDMGFGDMPTMPGSIFERAKDFPVRTDFPDFFTNVRSASPRRSESPIHQQHNQPKKSGSGSQPIPNNLGQSGSAERPFPVQHENVKRGSTPQRATTPQRQQTQPQAQQAPPQQAPPQQDPPKPEPQKSQEQSSTSAKQKALEDSITKIQKIQQSVLELMGRVEQYNGKDRKEYLYLDEMLTQNLLKLDNIDAEGKENIKSARREAIKCINSLISLLEAKNEEATSSNNSVEKSNSNESANQTEANVDQNAESTQNLNGTSKNSSYDNVNRVQETSSSNSVNMTDVPEKSAEASLEQKIAEAVNKQDDGVGQKQT